MILLCIKEKCKYFTNHIYDGLCICSLNDKTMNRDFISECDIESALRSLESDVDELKINLSKIRIGQRGDL